MYSQGGEALSHQAPILETRELRPENEGALTEATQVANGDRHLPLCSFPDPPNPVLTRSEGDSLNTQQHEEVEDLD